MVFGLMLMRPTPACLMARSLPGVMVSGRPASTVYSPAPGNSVISFSSRRDS